MKQFKYLLIVGLSLFLFSCGTVTTDRGLMPTYKQFRIWKTDLECVGETEISIDYSSYIGVIRKIHTVNGEVYDATKKHKSIVDTRIMDGINSNVAKGYNFFFRLASYKAYEEYPDAVYFQVVKCTKTKDKLFLGNLVTEKAVIRAYKYKE